MVLGGTYFGLGDLSLCGDRSWECQNAVQMVALGFVSCDSRACGPCIFSPCTGDIENSASFVTQQLL